MRKLSCLFLMSLGLVQAAQAADIIGSGEVIRQERNIAAVDTIDLQGIGELYITQGETESLSVEAEANLLPFIETTMVNNELQIWQDPEHTLHAIEPIRYHLMVKDIDGLRVAGNATLEMPKPYSTNHLKITVEGMAFVDIDIDADELELALSESAQVHAKGRVKKQNVQLNGSSKYQAEALSSRLAQLSASDASVVSVEVSDTLSADVSGHAAVAYKGSPTLHSDLHDEGSLSPIS